jgi:serine protease Do
MAKKHGLYLLAAIALSTSVALAQQQTNPPTPQPLESEPSVSSFSFFMDGEGFLGVNTEDINRDNIGKYGLRAVRGVGVTSVVKNSPAEKAGIRKDDVILRVDGDNVTSTRKLSRLISEIAPDQSVRITISRGGAEQELTATIAKRDNSTRWEGMLRGNPDIFRGNSGLFSVNPDLWRGENWPSDNGMTFAFGGRRIGVSTIPLTRQLADYFGIADGKGLLVTSVTEDGPAAKAGVKAGDVIISVNGEKVEAAGDISRVINSKKDGDVTLTIVRNKSQQNIQVTPKEGNSTIVTPSTSRVGRTIVIPRIELPAVPEVTIGLPSVNVAVPAVNVAVPSVNVAVPRIQLPVMPQININVPVIRPIRVKSSRVRTI